MEGAANRNLLLRCIYVPQPAPPWMCSKCMEVSKLSCTSNSSPSAATLNKRDRHQLAERAPLLQREQEVHTSAQGLSHIVKYVSPTFVYIFLKEPPPPSPGGTNKNCFYLGSGSAGGARYCGAPMLRRYATTSAFVSSVQLLEEFESSLLLPSMAYLSAVLPSLQCR